MISTTSWQEKGRQWLGSWLHRSFAAYMLSEQQLQYLCHALRGQSLGLTAILPALTGGPQATDCITSATAGAAVLQEQPPQCSISNHLG